MPDLYNRPKNHLDLIRYIKIVSDYTEKVPILYHHYPKYTQINSKYILTKCGVQFGLWKISFRDIFSEQLSFFFTNKIFEFIYECIFIIVSCHFS